MTLRRKGGLLLAVGVAVGFLIAAPSPAAPRTQTRPAPLLRAVVTLDGGGPVTAPGVRVLATFPHVGAEVVAATRAGLDRLAEQAHVLGISADLPMTLAGRSYQPSTRGVLAADVVGGDAGTPGAGRGVNVALLDTGVSDTAALNRASGRITDGVDVSELDAANGTVRTSGEFTDGFGHGTFLASLIAGDRVAGSGRRGIGVAPGARIVVVKVADDNGDTSLARVLAGFDWVAAHARGPAPDNQQMIQVLNVALSIDRPGAAYGEDPLTAAVEHVRDAGVVVVAAAGNDPGGLGDPGMDPYALTVGAADTSRGAASVAPFSGRGTVVAGVSKPDLVAPAVHVLGVMPAATRIWQDHPGGRESNGLFSGSGTSEASAVASGAVALLLSQRPDLSVQTDLSPSALAEHGQTVVRTVKASLRAAAMPIGSGGGAGLLQLPSSRDVPRQDRDTANESFDVAAWTANRLDGVDWVTLLESKWSALSWSALSWSALSWSALSWSALSWSALSWSAVSWSAVSWSGSAWANASWAAASWGDDE